MEESAKKHRTTKEGDSQHPRTGITETVGTSSTKEGKLNTHTMRKEVMKALCNTNKDGRFEQLLTEINNNKQPKARRLEPQGKARSERREHEDAMRSQITEQQAAYKRRKTQSLVGINDERIPRGS